MISVMSFVVGVIVGMVVTPPLLYAVAVVVGQALVRGDDGR